MLKQIFCLLNIECHLLMLQTCVPSNSRRRTMLIFCSVSSHDVLANTSTFYDHVIQFNEYEWCRHSINENKSPELNIVEREKYGSISWLRKIYSDSDFVNWYTTQIGYHHPPPYRKRNMACVCLNVFIKGHFLHYLKVQIENSKIFFEKKNSFK